MRRSWILMTATLLVLSACTSEERAPSPSVATAPQTAPTPESSTTTTIPDTIATSTASTTTVIEPTTTATEPTIMDTAPEPPPSSISAESVPVSTAIQAYWDAYWKCGQEPATCDPATYLAPGGDALDQAKSAIESMIASGLYFSKDLRGTRVTIGVVRIIGDKAYVDDCVYDAGIVLGPPGPDGKPTVVNDSISSVIYSHELIRSGEQWLVAREDRIADLGADGSC